MIGIVGKLEINYDVNGIQCNKIINLMECSKFLLDGIEGHEFIVDEIAYIEDTIYGVTIMMDDDDESAVFISGNDYQKYYFDNIELRMKLSFI